MRRKISRREFVKASVIASALPVALRSEPPLNAGAQVAKEPLNLAKGKIGNLEISRLIIGGNLIAGYAHARQLTYVSTLMRRYNTPQKILQTIELAEQNGITAINSWVMDDNSQLFQHWKNGGKMQWIAQVRLGSEGRFVQIDKALAEGAAAIHLTGDNAESLLDNNKFDEVGETVEYIRSNKKVAGVAAHDLRVIFECEKRKINADFYQKTLHPGNYFGGPKPGDPDRVGAYDNSWCSDPQPVIEAFSKISKPWIAFKVLAAGAVQPRAAFPFAVNGGADFLLVGMFDWQVEENATLARKVFRIAAGTDSKRVRPWDGATPGVNS